MSRSDAWLMIAVLVGAGLCLHLAGRALDRPANRFPARAACEADPACACRLIGNCDRALRPLVEIKP